MVTGLPYMFGVAVAALMCDLIRSQHRLARLPHNLNGSLVHIYLLGIYKGMLGAFDMFGSSLRYLMHREKEADDIL